jgi:hypothetical protein
MKCERCEDLKEIILSIFRETGYMDLYDNDMSMIGMVIRQGIRKDKSALELYREAGEQAVKALDVHLIPGSTQGVFK